MNEYTQHIITRLKHYSRIGMPSRTKQNRLKDIQKAQEEANKQQASELSKIKNIYVQIEDQILSLGESNAKLANGIGKVIQVQQGLAKQYKDLSDDINALAQRNADLQKSYGLTIEAAGELGYELDSQAVRLGTSRENIEKNYKALRTLTGGTRQNSDALMRLNQYYAVNRGLTQDATDGLLAFAASTTEVEKGQAATDAQLTSQVQTYAAMFKQIEKITGIRGAQKDIEDAIGSATADTRLTFSKYPAAMGMAVMKAKALGIELADLQSIGNNLLNIESSVGEELNYQLLTGHRLVDNQGKSLTNSYREAQLRGDANKQTDILNKILEDEGDTLQNNLLARQQMAKVLGIEESKLSAMVEKRKLIKKISEKGTPLELDILNKTGKELEEALTKAGVKPEDIAEVMKQDETRDPATRTAESLAKIEAEGIKIQMTDDKGNYNKKIISDAFTATQTAIKEFDATMADSFAKYGKDVRENLGRAQIDRKAYDATDEGFMQKLLELNKGQGGYTTIIATAASDVIKDVVGSLPAELLKGMEVKTMTVNGANVSVVGAGSNDAVMINDGLVSFNPRDKFRTINDGMTMAGTNVGGLDRYAAQMEKRDRNFEQNMGRMIANMSTAVTQAIQRANLKVNLDRTFSGNSLNPRGKYGG